MLTEVEKALPVDVAVFAAAVADWRVANAGAQKIKKTQGGMPPLQLVENPDIWRRSRNSRAIVQPWWSASPPRPENLIANARAKLARKDSDWIIANDVSPGSGVMGGDRNTIHLLTKNDPADHAPDVWPVMTKEDVAATLVARIAEAMKKKSSAS